MLEVSVGLSPAEQQLVDAHLAGGPQTVTLPTKAHPLYPEVSGNATNAEARQIRREDAQRLSRQRRELGITPRWTRPHLRVVHCVQGERRPRERRPARRASRHVARATSSSDPGDPPSDWPADLRPFSFAAFDQVISRRLPGHVRWAIFDCLPGHLQREAWNSLRDDAEAGR